MRLSAWDAAADFFEDITEGKMRKSRVGNNRSFIKCNNDIYVVMGFLQSGGSSTKVKRVQTRDQRKYVVKIVEVEAVNESSEYAWRKNEAQIAQAVGLSKGFFFRPFVKKGGMKFYLVMEDAGLNLREYIDKKRPHSNTLIEIFLKCTQELMYMQNKRFIHRDIKLGNIAFNGRKVKFIDVETAVFLNEGESGIEDCEVFTTTGYSAPEIDTVTERHEGENYGPGLSSVKQRQRVYTFQSDIYALGKSIRKMRELQKRALARRQEKVDVKEQGQLDMISGVAELMCAFDSDERLILPLFMMLLLVVRYGDDDDELKKQLVSNNCLFQKSDLAKSYCFILRSRQYKLENGQLPAAVVSSLEANVNFQLSLSLMWNRGIRNLTVDFFDKDGAFWKVVCSCLSLCRELKVNADQRFSHPLWQNDILSCSSALLYECGLATVERFAALCDDNDLQCILDLFRKHDLSLDETLFTKLQEDIELRCILCLISDSICSLDETLLISLQEDKELRRCLLFMKYSKLSLDTTLLSKLVISSVGQWTGVEPQQGNQAFVELITKIIGQIQIITNKQKRYVDAEMSSYVDVLSDKLTCLFGLFLNTVLSSVDIHYESNAQKLTYQQQMNVISHRNLAFFNPYKELSDDSRWWRSRSATHELCAEVNQFCLHRSHS